MCFVGEDYLPATRVGGAAFCFLLTTFPFFAFLSFVSNANAIRKMMRRRNSILRIRCLAPARRPVITVARRNARAVMNEPGITRRTSRLVYAASFVFLPLRVARYATDALHRRASRDPISRRPALTPPSRREASAFARKSVPRSDAFANVRENRVIE